MAEEKEYLRIPGHMPVKEAAAILGLSEERVLQHIRARHLPSRKIDGRYMIPVAEFAGLRDGEKARYVTKRAIIHT